MSGDVFTPNALLMSQQDVSTILEGNIKPAKTHLCADNTVLPAAALFKSLSTPKLPFCLHFTSAEKWYF